MQEILKKIQKDSVTIDDLEYLISTDKYNDEILSLADEIRGKYVGNEVHIRAIIEFSNYCKMDCLYCGLRAPNKNLKRYRMTPEEIYKRAQLIAQKKYKNYCTPIW